MIVAIGTFEMHFPEVHNIKHKRQILKSILDRLRARFNVSAAEVAHNELWQRARLGVAIVANKKDFLQSVAQKIEETIERNSEAEITDQNWEYI